MGVVETVSYEEAKQLALDYWTKKRDGLPLPLRDLPRKVVRDQPLSVNDIIAHITSNTDIGVWIVGEYAGSLGMVIG